MHVDLRDGSAVTIRPLAPEDKPLLLAGFERLSDESRYKRFLVPMPRLTDAQASYLVDVDHHDHEALIALDDDAGEAVGVARYVREPGEEVAEAAVTVIDDWQGRGLGTVLLEAIAERAREEGVRRFTALMLAGNRDMYDLLERLGPTHVVAQQGETLEAVVDLPEEGVPAQLRDMLRAAADGSVRVVHRVAGALGRAADEDDEPGA